MIVVFDLGGVLLSANHTWRSALAAAGVGMPAGMDPEEAVFALPEYLPYEAGRIHEDEYLSALGARAGANDPRALHEAILGPEYPGVREVVADLKARGVRTGCLSNNNPIHWARMLDAERYPAIALLDVKAASFELGFHKPQPEIYRAFEQAVGERPEEILFFEDSPANAEGARAAGWDAVLLDVTQDRAPQLRAALAVRGILL